MTPSHTLRLVLLMTPLILGAQKGWASPGPLVNDVTGLNPIAVDKIAKPNSVEEVQRLLRETRGPVSIGGGKFSMGGQIGHEGSLHLDMTALHRILEINIEKRTLRVQAGARWRDIQEALDPLGLSIRIMQTYANFTVGGSLSVNVHGRYVGEGPLIRSVEWIQMVLADGTRVTASPEMNPELFYGAIGGYGGLGVIVEAQLGLTTNTHIRRRTQTMAIQDYPLYFQQLVRTNRAMVFHNADLYPNGFNQVMAVSWEETNRPLTVDKRLQTHGPTTAWERGKMLLISEVPFMKDARRIFFDPLYYKTDLVVTRNYEASYDVAELEPASRKDTTYVLQEYFVPAQVLPQFIPVMAQIFQKHKVNVINVSIRHAWADPGSTLAWARGETFALVVYYKQGTRSAQRDAVGQWTRELIDHTLSLGGTYYLPYQPHATFQQFLAAYPNAPKFFSLKAKVDPLNRFRNKLWDAYYRPGVPTHHLSHRDLKARPGYQRREDQSFLTLPEWYIVFSYEEYANWIGHRAPSAFPYFQSAGQFWALYGDVAKSVKNRYPWNGPYHLMNAVIGLSFSVEYALKGLYESTFGKFSEWVAGGNLKGPEDQYLAQTARDYLAFIRVKPWYEFSFLNRLGPLWQAARTGGPHPIRRWERRLSASAEFTVKALWAQVITWGSKAAYGAESQTTSVLVGNTTSKILPGPLPVDKDLFLIELPRYEAFTRAATTLLGQAVVFKEICGNERVMVSFWAPKMWRPTSPMDTVSRWLVLSEPDWNRIAVAIPVASLGPVISKWTQEGLRLDHIFDY